MPIATAMKSLCAVAVTVTFASRVDDRCERGADVRDRVEPVASPDPGRRVAGEDRDRHGGHRRDRAAEAQAARDREAVVGPAGVDVDGLVGAGAGLVLVDPGPLVDVGLGHDVVDVDGASDLDRDRAGSARRGSRRLDVGHADRDHHEPTRSAVAGVRTGLPTVPACGSSSGRPMSVSWMSAWPSPAAGPTPLAARMSTRIPPGVRLSAMWFGVDVQDVVAAADVRPGIGSPAGT